jgi:uridine phosphorylase
MHTTSFSWAIKKSYGKSHIDSIEFSTKKREFKPGLFKGKRISVISTGIGPDNIDIVINELDALVNNDLETRKPKETLTSLNIIRTIRLFLQTDILDSLDVKIWLRIRQHASLPIDEVSNL